MAARPKKKTAARKPSASKRGPGLSSIGWLATAAVAGAWAVSDGRPMQHAASLFAGVRETAESLPGGDRIASLIQDTPSPRIVPKREADHRAPPPPGERTGSIRPAAPKPAPLQAAALPRPEQPIPTRAPEPKLALTVPTPAPMLPFQKPRTDLSLAKPIAMPMAPVASAVAAVAGAERHATRALAVHAEPDGTSARLAEIDSGSSVLVLRSAGDWRYVRNPRSNSEGWVDGRFLAGEASASASVSIR